ncbi:MAG: DUF47 domain-containing protein [Candidatus Nezhaarchaeota archaeon]|nr:DUF47 domain-containing protein [Candidatus Nezhaarchaeota archaeon]MCX8141457.1 DUF47 domain-containing protein [Candidatus Nezhaarchaeota archaeon]MDW8049723.1 DUF47 family protein [Nitrososphaerota archaeon]
MTLEKLTSEAAAHKLLDFVMEQGKKLWTSFKQLEEMMDIYLSGKTSNKRIKELADAINIAEKEGNEIKLQIYDYLARVGEALMYREDWIRLVLNLDSIIDYIDSISFRLSIAVSKKWYPTPETSNGFKRLSSLVGEMLDKLRYALSVFQSNALKALEVCNELEEREREIDEAHRALGFMLLESNISTPALMLLHEVCERLETLADLALRTGDSLRILALHRIP